MKGQIDTDEVATQFEFCGTAITEKLSNMRSCHIPKSADATKLEVLGGNCYHNCTCCKDVLFMNTYCQVDKTSPNKLQTQGDHQSILPERPQYCYWTKDKSTWGGKLVNAEKNISFI